MGTEAFWIPAVVAAAASGAQYVNQNNAAKRQDAGEAQSIRDQQALQQKASGAASSLTRQIQTDSPQSIAAKSTGDYVSQLRRNAAGSTQGGSTSNGIQAGGASSSSLAPVAGGSSRYNSAKAQSQKDVTDYGNTTAGEMGQIDAAIRQRQNEGLNMQDLQTGLNTLGAQSYSTNFVDQLRAAAAGQANPWVSLISGMVQKGALAGAMNAGAAAPGGAAGTAAGYNATGLAPAGGGYMINVPQVP